MTNYDPQRPAEGNQYRPQDSSVPAYQPSYEASGYQAPQEASTDSSSAYPAGSYQPSAPAGGYAGYQPAGAYQGGYQASPSNGGTNVLAIVSLVASIVGFFFLYIIGPIAGIVLAHMARKQIDQTGEAGSGIATAGWWTGWVGLALQILFIVGWVILFVIFAAAGSSYESY